MIPLSTLRHTASVSRVSNTGAKDEYNNAITSVENSSFQCYFDGQVEDYTFFYQKQSVRAEAVLFIHPTTKVKLGDKVLKVQDTDGNDIINNEYIIGHILPSADLNRMHHTELYLVTALK